VAGSHFIRNHRCVFGTHVNKLVPIYNIDPESSMFGGFIVGRTAVGAEVDFH
jgi:hypothetical protein